MNYANSKISRSSRGVATDPSAETLNVIADQVQRSLDRIVEHCAEVLDCEIALVTVLGSDTQIFLASVGTEIIETPLEMSFCKFAVASQHALLVGNASEDGRFKENPLVTGEPHISSYMGCPIRDPSGELIGALCAIDSRTDHFQNEQIPSLQRLARGVEDSLKMQELMEEKTLLIHELSKERDATNEAMRVCRHAEKVAMLGSFEYDVKSGISTWSDQIFAIYGEAPGHQISPEHALSYYAATDQAKIREQIKSVIAGEGPIDFETSMRTRQGQLKRIRIRGELVEAAENEDHKIVGVCQDITDSYRAKVELQYVARHDSLTGLLNRYAFDELLRDQLSEARRDGTHLTIIMIDLDGFKDINDKFGHMIGDVILEEIADRIGRTTPADSIAARWGGDEFAIVISSSIDETETLAIGQALIDEIQGQLNLIDYPFQLGATVGIAVSTVNSTAKELVRRADTALYFGKRREPGTPHIYSSEMEEENFARQQAIDEVQAALSSGRVYVGYQPIVDLKSSQTVGFEALMRLTSASGDHLTAGEVLPALVAPMISRKIGIHMLNLITEEFAQLIKSYPDLEYVNINASEADLLSRGFATQFLNVLRRKDINPAKVTLEITETMLLVEDTGSTRRILETLRQTGIKIALDDFGTGYSSLSHLKDFPIDKVKIDKSFVQSLSTTGLSRTIVRALIQMAAGMNLDVIAEGIETEEQLAILSEMGCRYGQGFLFGAAQDIELVSLGGLKKSISSKSTQPFISHLV